MPDRWNVLAEHETCQSLATMAYPHCRLMVKRRSSRWARGFTLVEMMIVVCIIAVFAAIAAPSIINLIRDQRSLRDTVAIMNIYREAKARALGRGGAVKVEYNDSADATVVPPGPTWTVREAVTIDGGTGLTLPNPLCASAQHTTLLTIAPSRVDGKSSTKLTLSTTSTTIGPKTPWSAHNVCFSPTGRVYEQLGGIGSWTILPARILIDTQRLDNGTTPLGTIRTIQISVDGNARLLQP